MSSDWQYMLDSLPFLLQAAIITVLLSAGGIVGSLIFALIIALCRMSTNRVLSWIARTYISFFRGTPLLIQLFIIYYGFRFLINFEGWQAALIGLILHFSAYIAETYRGAIQSIPKGQWEAANSLGMSYLQTFREVIFPQAWRIAIPAVWNSLIDIVKSSSLASAIAVDELTAIANQRSAASLIILPVLMEAAVMYWLFSVILEWARERIERKLRLPNE
ncbi:polar amino acid ABC transporter inner membrane subunit [Fictibacillus macauensis ZFHKF-1]|uniref:Polar amino acid ABC transporter inner membrane subunit n=1 Tax=Fictibacillus macauensis ZFHKF-1 TaxID=1196324 RepID=I8AJB1_9BACL|nr:amino acid ABC transporter permease [Fictibacillus macauensis]EIT85877.1 polar amino acid ABC transporter inner membrane subunit [Fictibacillus macauensis ZFHKF-1]